MTTEAESSVGSSLEKLKTVGLGKGVVCAMPLILSMKEIVTPDESNIDRPPVASEVETNCVQEFVNSEFAETLELNFDTGAAQALNCNVSFMKGSHHSSSERRTVYVGKVLSETVTFSDEPLPSSSIPFEKSLRKAAKKYPGGNLNDKQRDEICKEVIERVYENTTHFISSVDLGRRYSLVIEEEETTDGEEQGMRVSTNIETFIKAKLGLGDRQSTRQFEGKEHVKISTERIGKLDEDRNPRDVGIIRCKLKPIWSVIRDEGWKESVKRVCSEILPVPVGEKKSIVIKAAGASPTYLKVSKVNSAAGATRQPTSKWEVNRTATKSEASEIYVVADKETNTTKKTNDGDGDTVISLYTEIDDERIFLTPENGILAAKGCQSGKESKFVLVEPRNCDRTCDVREWQSRQPLCIRQAERKLTFPCFGFSSPQFVAFSTNEGSDSTPVMKTARDISSAEDWTSQFLIEPANII
jgi:hypothetical protein